MTNDEPSRQLVPPSVLVLTKNEEVNIARCLDALQFSDDIVVLDSFSRDRTVEIAQQYKNVRVMQRVFDTETSQRNHGLHEIEYRHPWVYICDADERVTSELAQELTSVIGREPEEVAFRVRYRNMFMGRWIRHGGMFDTRVIRFVRPKSVRYEDRAINVHPIVDGPIGELTEPFIHYSFNKGLDPWFRKHNGYSTGEAAEATQVLEGSNVWAEFSRMFRGDSAKERRRGFKNLSFFIPFRGPARFVYMTVLKRGAFDGSPGMAYAAMVSMYEHWIEAKLKSHRQRWGDKSRATATKALGRPWR